jgi:flavin reductase (DIM6/NTAB) family NADH-FMN oxidoreductase RutF
MGNFCSGIVVVTAIEGGEPAGFTAQSFISLSIEPPLVAICPAKTSTSWQRIRKAESFCINILSAEQESLSNNFASSGGDKFANIEWQASKSGSPILEHSLASIDCVLETEHDAGDHLIAVGRVLDFMVNDEQTYPLLYFRGQYHSTKN